MRIQNLPSRRFLYSCCSVMVLLSLFTVFGERGILDLWHLRAEKETLDERNFVLLSENESLRQRIDRLRHDDFYLEKIAREELGLVRPGEIVYNFGAESKRASRSVSAPPPERPRSSEQKSR